MDLAAARTKEKETVSDDDHLSSVMQDVVGCICILVCVAE